MGYFVFALVAAVVVYYMFIRKGDASASPSEASRKAIKNQALPLVAPTQFDYLKTQWTAAETARASGMPTNVSSWFFDPVSERQLERLKKDGTKVSGGSLTKGTASDLIGLQEPIEENDADILKFFKVPLKGTNQTIGRYEAKRLLSIPENATAWNSRPAEPMQKEYLKFFGLNAPKGLICVDATELITAHKKETNGVEKKRLDTWANFESIVDDLSDRETREDYDIKKPSLAAIRAAVEALEAKGEDSGDLQCVVDQLLEMKPELAKEG